MIDMKQAIGKRFQQETKYTRNTLGGGLDWNQKPALYKTYPTTKTIPLSHPSPLTSMSLDEVLKRRKSIRQFSQKPLTSHQLSYLLWASTGIQREQHGMFYRTAPSAGALYPIETYLACHAVSEIPSGLYHYSVRNHEVEELKQGDFRHKIAHAALEQEMCAQAAVVFLWTSIFSRSTWKYRQRAYRYIYLDCGHIAHNLALAATSLGLGSCQIAALFDDEINDLLDVDGDEESILYMSVVGHPQEKETR